MQRKTFSVFAILLIAALVVTACAPAPTAPVPPAASDAPATDGAMTEVGAGEGQLDIIAWAGYIERGETDPA